jgi:broad specificity phosphatase PhoE
MLITITLFRHAPTVFNIGDVFMGLLDIPCDYEQLNKIHGKYDYLAKDNDMVYSSPLTRAFETAKYIFPNKLIIVDKRLTEKNLGIWAGQKINYLKNQYPNAFLNSGHLDPLFVPFEGESHKDMMIRCKSFLNEIIIKAERTHEDTRIVVVTHNGVIRLVRFIIEKYPIVEIFKTNEPYLSPIDFTFELSDWHEILK